VWAASARPLTSAEMAVVEANAVALGVTVDQLMEGAGRAVAEEAMRHLPSPPATVAVVAGVGNNGGDATCAAFYLHQWGYQPEIYLLKAPAEISTRPARRCFDRVERLAPVHVGVPRAEELATKALVLDGLLGTGQGGRLRSPVKEAALAITASGVPVLAIDVPTGIDDPEGLRPRWTVTLTIPKAEMTATNSGEIVVRDIGVPPEAWRRTGPGEFLFLPRTVREGAGRRSGRLVVIGGGPYSGAPALAALAALRSGTERATVVVPEGSAERVQSFSPNLVVQPFGTGRFRPTDAGEIVEFVRSSKPRAVVLGMGAGHHPETVDALTSVERSLAGEVPLVVDADGLAGLPSAEEISARGGHPIVATPNVGEFAHYFGGVREGAVDEQGERARSISAARRVVLLSKGETDLLTDGVAWFENAHHPGAITVSGAGDVLGGVVGSLLAQGLSAPHAGRLAAWWCGEAGARVAAHKGFGLVATDIIEELPLVLVAQLAHLRGT
jgi:ADP-dependent NAD(P)H-hydrate dehydratase / NAD(P)H-hydrate epimerase